MPQVVFFGELADYIPLISSLHVARIDRKARAEVADLIELLLTDVNRDDRCTFGAGNLYSITTDTADADHDCQVAGQNLRLFCCLVWRCQGISDDAGIRQFHADISQTSGIDLAKSRRRHCHVAGKSTMRIHARKSLSPANRAVAAFAKIAGTTGDNGRDDHRFVLHMGSVSSGTDYVPTRLVAQRQRQRVLRSDTVVIKAEICVADAATGDCNHDLAFVRGIGLEFHSGKRFVRAFHYPAVSVH